MTAVAEAAGGVRRILAAIDAGEPSCSAVYRDVSVLWWRWRAWPG